MLAAAFVPHPPALVPELSGGPVALAAVRAATTAAVEALLAEAPTGVCVVGGGPVYRRYAATELSGACVLDALAAYGGRGPRPTAHGTLPLALAIGGWLLDRAGYQGTRSGLAVPAGSDVPPTGSTMSPGATDALLVVGDGSARRDGPAPGAPHPAAAAFDDTVAAALAAGNPDALAALDLEVASEVLAAGAGAWRAAGTLLAGRDVLADLRYYGAPFGVGYLVASWTVR